MGVSDRTIRNWLVKCDLVIDDSGLIEAARKRIGAMLPSAATVYSKALQAGHSIPNTVSLSAAKDVLKNAGVLQEKVEIEHTLKTMDDKDLEQELVDMLKRDRGIK